VGSITNLPSAALLGSSTSLPQLGSAPSSVFARSALPTIAAGLSKGVQEVSRGSLGVAAPEPSVTALLNLHASSASLTAQQQAKDKTLVKSGFYAGQYLSDKALQVIEVGRKAAAYIHEKRRRDAGGDGVLVSMGTNASVGEGAALLYNPRAAVAEAQAAAAAVAAEVRETFIESLHLPPHALEALAKGNFLYLKRVRLQYDFNVYDLAVVDHKETDPEDYFTVSSEGVTHVSPRCLHCMAGV
jgi:hypothetical protein